MQHSMMTSLTSWDLPDICHVKNHGSLSNAREDAQERYFWGATTGNYDYGVQSDYA